jgi:subfamily B ATP-binding cassette protein MsbA
MASRLAARLIMIEEKADKKSSAAEARALIALHRGRMYVGLLILLVNRGCAFVLPFSAKYFFDDVIPNQNISLLWWLVTGVLLAVFVEAISGFALAQ